MSITIEIYKYLVEKYTLNNGIFQSGKISLLEFNVSKMPKLIGMDMFNIASVLEGTLVVAISRNGKIIIPHGSTKIMQNDGLYIIGERARITDLSRMSLVMIIGRLELTTVLLMFIPEFWNPNKAKIR